MPILSNDILRSESMKKFLTVMGVNTNNVILSSIEGLYSFNFDNLPQAESFAQELCKLLQKEHMEQPPTPKTIDLSTLIEQEVTEATCVNETDRHSCRAIFDIIKALKTEFSFSSDAGAIEITLPNQAYVPLLSLLKYPHMSFSADGKIIIDIKTYLKTIAEDVIKIEALSEGQAPVVFLNSSALESKQVFYATKPIDESSVEITPYFFVPNSTQPPKYHFVLDLSGSMEQSLPDLKRSVIKLHRQLFDFQPHAELTITTFSNGIHPLGTYTQLNSQKLEDDISQMRVKGDTPLYEVTAKFLEQITTSSDHHNILLFTDGEEAGSYKGSSIKISDLITPLSAQPMTNTVARNKFYIFSYKSQQSTLMQDVASTFQSPIINTSSADFLAAQQDPQLMKEWAAKRELFTSRVFVKDSFGATTENTYLIPLNMSGQLASLPSRVCKFGESVQIEITSGSGDEVVHDTKTFTAPQPALLPTTVEAKDIVLPPQGLFARLLTNFGLHAATAQTPRESSLADPTNDAAAASHP